MMISFVNINEKPPRYSFIDAKCIGRRCFHPILEEGGKGTCSNRKYRGCPDPLPEFIKESADRNAAQGWRLKR